MVGRIRILSEKRLGYAATGCGPLYEEEPSGHLALSRRTISRMNSIEALCAKYPWAREADLMLVLEGWDMGSGFAQYNADTEDRDTETSYSVPPVSEVAREE